MLADPQQRFATRLLDIYTGSILTQLIDIGHRTDLFETLALGPGSCHQISARAGLQERYVREWLGAMATAGIVCYDIITGTYALTPAHAPLLTGQTARNVAPRSRVLNSLSQHVAGLSDCFRHGGGIPYVAYQPEFTHAMHLAHCLAYDEHLVNAYVDAVNGLRSRLHQGIDVLDIGCGTGHVLNLLARAFPHSTFHGYDVAAEAIALARSQAETMRLSNVTFVTRDAAALPSEPRFDLIIALDAIHHQHAPAAVLRRIHQALAPGGIFLMVEHDFSSHLAENLDNPLAPLYYGLSVMHCLTVSLAEGGAGLGIMWGRQAAIQALAEAGFTQVEVLQTPRPQNCMFVCRQA